MTVTATGSYSGTLTVMLREGVLSTGKFTGQMEAEEAGIYSDVIRIKMPGIAGSPELGMRWLEEMPGTPMYYTLDVESIFFVGADAWRNPWYATSASVTAANPLLKQQRSSATQWGRPIALGACLGTVEHKLQGGTSGACHG